MEYNYLDFDVETAVDSRINDYLEQSSFFPKKNLKDQEKIKKDIMEKKEKVKAQAPLFWYLSRPVVIVAYDDSKDITYSFNNQDPTLLLIEFCNLLTSEAYQNHILVGKNSSKFDMPMITGWLLKYNLGVPHHFKRHLKGPLTDIDHIFGYSATMNSQISALADYAFGLNIDGKTMSGADVGDLYMQYQMGINPSALDIITEYCKQDVYIVTEMRRRFQKPYINRSTTEINLEGVF